MQTKFVDSRRLFYGKYLYKAVVSLPKARIIYDSAPVTECITRRHTYHLSMHMFRNQVHNAADTYSRFKEMYRISEERLNYYRTVYLESRDLRFRVEEPWLDIYSNDYAELTAILRYDPDPQYNEIHRPATDATRAIIERGEMVATDRHNGVDYRVNVREGFLKHDIRNILLSLAETYPTDVYLPKRFKEKISNSAGHTWLSGYFYVNDLKLLTFINLVDPNFVTSFFKLTRPEQ